MIILYVKNIIGDGSVFMGPIADDCVAQLSNLDNISPTMIDSFSTISSYLSDVSEKYKAGDTEASSVQLRVSDSSTTSSTGTLTGSTNEEKAWNYLISKGFSKAGAAAILGNLTRESSIIPSNVQNGMGYSDEEYVNGIKNGTISRESFINDKRGFGIVQWTYSSRKAKLYDTLGPQNIDNLQAQLEFMYNEMGSDLKQAMSSATDVASATKTFHDSYERSADKTMTKRTNSATEVYNRYA